MFENDLKAKFKRIFGFKKTTFASPSESHEQETLFIEIQKANSQVRDGRINGKVTGQAFVFAESDKLPLTYLSQRIRHADLDDTKDLFFFDLESNVKGLQNLVQRSFSFVYLFNSQYDPDLGSITSTTFTEVT